jgi:ribosomal protein S18 acetylase RimI-like enzyme
VIRLADKTDSFTLVIDGVTGRNRAGVQQIIDDAILIDACLVHTNDDGAVDGFVVAPPKSLLSRDFVRLIGVAPASRHSGIARALLAAVLERATTPMVFISTNESNTAMRALLAKDSWTYSGSLTGIDPGDPELFFWHDAKPTAR